MVNDAEKCSSEDAASKKQPAATPKSAITVPRLRQMKEKGEKIVMLTCYDSR